MTHQGHLPDGSSVQRHSAGATYPYIVVAYNDRTAVQAPDGRIVFERFFGEDSSFARRSAYAAAIDKAARLAAGGAA